MTDSHTAAALGCGQSVHAIDTAATRPTTDTDPPEGIDPVLRGLSDDALDLRLHNQQRALTAARKLSDPAAAAGLADAVATDLAATTAELTRRAV